MSITPLKRKYSQDQELLYWQQVKDFIDQETFIDPTLLDNDYFQEYLYQTYCLYHRDQLRNYQDSQARLRIVLDIHYDYLDEEWTKEEQKQAITSKKLDPHFPPVHPFKRTGKTEY